MKTINLTIGKRLAIGFGVILLLVLVQVVVVALQLSRVAGDAERIEAALANRANAVAMNSTVKDNGISSIEMLLSTNTDHHATVLKEIEARNGTIGKQLQGMEKDLASPQEKKLLEELKKTEGIYLAGLQKVGDLLKEGKHAEATYLAGEEMIPMLDPFIAAIKKVDDHQKAKLDASIVQIRKAAGATRTLAVVVGTVVVLLGLGSAGWIIASITGPLNRMRETITEVEKNGDLTRRVAITSADEVGMTANAFDHLLETLQQTIADVNATVSVVAESSRALMETSHQVSEVAANQSVSTSTMAASVEEMTTSISQVSESAREAMEISRQSGRLSAEGGATITRAAEEMGRIADSVRNASQTMEQVEAHSSQISSVIQVIEDIADQTNLLALNASIEAARAGEQGRGFAVVADEVRTLADRTTKATKEITGMIGAMQTSAKVAVTAMETTVGQVSGGVALAQRAGEAVSQIRDGENRVDGVIGYISQALAEQTVASNDYASQVENVARATELNSTAAAKLASEAENLQSMAQAMQASVARFRI